MPAAAQPPLVDTPADVVDRFLEHSRAGDFAQLAPLFTPGSLQAAGPLADMVQAGDMGRLYFHLLGLLQPAQQCDLDATKLLVNGDVATVPIRKTLAVRYDLVLRKAGRQWQLDLTETLRPSSLRFAEPRALVEEFALRLRTAEPSAQLPLLSSDARNGLGFEFPQRELGHDDLDDVVQLAMLLFTTPETQVQVGRPVVTGDRATVQLTKTVPFSGTLALKREEAGWKIDLLQSAVASGAMPPKALALMRAQATQTACSSNVKQVLLALHQYAQDHGGKLPEGATWTDGAQPYLRNAEVFRCPARPEAACGYALNARLAGKDLKDVNNPGETVLLFESTAGVRNAADEGTSLASRHEGGVLVGYADGHVQWLTADMAKEALGLVQVDARPLPDPNAFDDYVAAGKLAKDAGGSREAHQDTAMVEQQRAVLAACAPALQRLREGFGKEFMNPPVRSFDTPFPYLADFRELGRVLLVEAALATREGRFGTAANSYLDMVRLAHDVPRGAPLIHALVGVAIEGMALAPLSKLVPKLDEQAAMSAVQRLRALHETAVRWDEVLAEESLASRHAVLHQDDAMEEVQRQAGAAGPGGQVVLQRSLPHIEQFYKAAVEEARKPFHARQAVPIPDDPLAKTLLPMLEKATLGHAVAETRLLLVMTQLAVRVCELRNHALPGELASLVPDLLPAVPQDPFHAGPLAYRVTPEGCLLYSFGPDGDDDRGKALAPKDAKVDGADGDLVPG
jgi:prepilin-type processing-associated H-X9-DG protein